MIEPSIPANESSRQRLLNELQILDTDKNRSFDNITQLVSQLLDVPIVAVSLIDINRQWFKSSVGLDVCETGRDVSFCGHVVADNDMLFVADTHNDSRFIDNPLVTGSPHIRSYIGIPLRPSDNEVVGTLCAIDTRVRHFTDTQIKQLQILAEQTESLLKLNRSQAQAANLNDKLAREKAKLIKDRALMSTLHRGIADFNTLLSGNLLWDFLQSGLRDLTSSEYAFIAERVDDSDGEAALKIQSITDLSWDDASRDMYEGFLNGNTLFKSQTSLIGKVFHGGQKVIMPCIDYKIAQRKFPPGHPVLDNFLGLPIIDNGEVLGMVAIANTEQTVNESLANWLEPFVATCALIIRLYRMIENNKQFTRELQNTKNDMEKANKAKNDFLSSMSHELRTPLNSIIGFSQLLLNQTKHSLAEKQTTQVKQIHASGKHLLTLINEVLDLSKIEAGKISLSIEPINVITVVEESIKSLEPLALKSHIAIQHNITPNLSILADYTRVKQVMINLISNAIKYNRPNGSVLISADINDINASIAVKDTGNGIEPNQLDSLFEPFNRLGAENSGIEGTGVGLALSAKLVQAMNGEITVDSSQLGSIFTVHLPLSDSSLESFSETHVLPTHFTQQHKKVLYVEENPANQALMVDIFEDIDGFELQCANDAMVGYDMGLSSQPDLIILDINLPEIDGFQLINMFKQHANTSHIPIIALSANALHSDIKKGLDAGFEHYLVKPIDIPHFIKVLQHYFPHDMDYAI